MRKYKRAVRLKENIDWVCASCELGENFDFRAALLRILPASSRPRKRVFPLVRAITAEQVRISCLSKTEITRPQFRPGSELPLLCLNLMHLLRKYCTELTGYQAVVTTGDGNCLFNSVSYLLCGQESLAAELRLRTLIELTCNKQFYLEMYGRYGFSGTADYDEAILDCAKEGAYSCIWTYGSPHLL